ncbi:AMP-activated serine/threonine-protein kinase regulatory subunit [Malassezia sp. CBS 17886]|nr:AMP-activated serine/threonine-protein kinase regulatory subunit [Malassezia sp. CBS 17886]
MSTLRGEQREPPAARERAEVETGSGSTSDNMSVSLNAGRRVDRRLAHLKNRHLHALHGIRHFLRTHSSYDVLPVSFRLVVLDTKLTMRSALEVMCQAGVVSAPLWRSTLAEEASGSAPHERPGFAGMITVNDIIHLIQYYYHTSVMSKAPMDVETMPLERLREIEQTLNVPPPPLLWIGPLRSLAEAGELLVRTHARRIPLLDRDEELGVETVVSVLTQYRLLKFIAMNCPETAGLKASIGSLGIGTYIYTHQLARRRNTPWARLRMHPVAPPEDAGPYWPLQTATLDTTVFDVVHMFSQTGISAVPILDADGDVVDIYESVDVITLVRTGAYNQLDLTVRQALERRPGDYTGAACCTSDESLASVFALLRSRRVHRILIVERRAARDGGTSSGTSSLIGSMSDEGALRANAAVDDDAPPLCRKGRLVGLLCLSDILRYIIGNPLGSVSLPSPAPVPPSPDTSVGVPHVPKVSPTAPNVGSTPAPPIPAASPAS